MPYLPIENYALIGNMHTAALVGKNGSIDFMCHPHFDSPTIFAALLDDEKGGRFMIRPMLEDVRQRQLYVPDTSVLLTRFLSEEGVAELSDFMPMGAANESHALVRRAKTVRRRGALRIPLRTALQLRPGVAPSGNFEGRGNLSLRSPERSGAPPTNRCPASGHR